MFSQQNQLTTLAKNKFTIENIQIKGTEQVWLKFQTVSNTLSVPSGAPCPADHFASHILLQHFVTVRLCEDHI